MKGEYMTYAFKLKISDDTFIVFEFHINPYFCIVECVI